MKIVSEKVADKLSDLLIAPAMVDRASICQTNVTYNTMTCTC